MCSILLEHLEETELFFKEDIIMSREGVRLPKYCGWWTQVKSTKTNQIHLIRGDNDLMLFNTRISTNKI
jgi:hypothetical protein